MIGDKLILLKKHYVKAKKILNYLKDKLVRDAEHKYVIVIGGESGTGKTEVAYILRKLLWRIGFTSYVISLDDYYKTDYRIRNQVREMEGIEKTVGTQEIDWHCLEKVISDYYSKKTIKIEEINKFAGEIERKAISTSFNILIVEGLYSCHLSANHSFYLEGSITQTKKFRIKRGKEEQNDFRDKVLEREKKEVRKTKDRADLIIPF